MDQHSPAMISGLTGRKLYVATDLITADYYWSPTQATRVVVEDQTSYYVSFFNHRLTFVKASDVNVVWDIHPPQPLDTDATKALP